MERIILNFKFEIMYSLSSKEEMFELERNIVNEDLITNPLTYNLKIGGSGGNPGIVGAFKGKKHSDETKEKQRQASLKQITTDEKRKKLSVNNAMKNNPKIRKKVSETLTGRTCSNAHRRRVAEANLGTILINNGIIAKRIPKDDLAKYTNAVVVISMCSGVRIDRAVQNYAEMRITHYTDFQSEHLGRKNKYIQVTPILSLNIDNPDDRVLLTSMNFDLEEFKQLSTIFYAMFLLQKKHDNFLFFDYMPFKHNKNTVDIIDQKNIITRQQLDLTENSINHSSTPNWSDIDPGYHTLPERQIQIADYLENRVWCGIL